MTDIPIIIVVVIVLILHYIFMYGREIKIKTSQEKVEIILKASENICKVLELKTENQSYEYVEKHYMSIYSSLHKISDYKIYKRLNTNNKVVIASNYIRLLNTLRKHGQPVRDIYIIHRTFTKDWIRYVLKDDIDYNSRSYLNKELDIILDENNT